jgi:DNA polymerase III epsilon subunit-like protein
VKVLLENWKNYLKEKIEVKGKNLEQLIIELQDLSKSSFIFFDTETMGLYSKNDQITQLAYVIDSIKGIEEKEMIAFLTEQSRDRLESGTEENQRWLSAFDKEIQKEKETADRMLGKQKISKLEYEQRMLKIQKKINQERDPAFVLKLTHYNPEEATMTEEEMLTVFIDDITNKYPNSVLVAHNAPFDEKTINTRNEIYGLPKISGEEQLGNVLDTLALCRVQYVPQLKIFLQELESQINQLSHENNISIKQENESLLDKIKLAGKNLKPVDKQILMLNILRDATLKTLQNKDLKNEEEYSYKLGEIAKTFNIDPEGAHRAINDVRMLAKVYKEMLRILILINYYLKDKELVINEFLKEVEIKNV